MMNSQVAGCWWSVHERTQPCGPTVFFMRIAYLDCFSGISGDMFLGALVDAGVSRKLLEDTVAALDIGARLEISRVMRSGISATKVDVYAHGEKDLPREVFQAQKQQEHAHDHTHDDSHHPHGHEHDDAVGHKPSHEESYTRAFGKTEVSALRNGHEPGASHDDSSHAHGRSLSAIRTIIEGAAISAGAKRIAIRIFEGLATAEAEIHNVPVEKVHFHEVGAVDAMVDIVCAAVGAESLGIEEWVCSPLNVGGGTVKCAHGTLPIPAPATLTLLQGAPVYSSGPQVELVTPTGAAIVKVLVTRFAALPAIKVEKAGYGAGTREFADHPNLLRITVGESASIDRTSEVAGGLVGASSSAWAEKIMVLEANLDDLSPQVLAYAMERLLTEGALDVFSVPVQMKKGRAGAVLTVLAKMEDAGRLTKTIFAETTTLGVRRREEYRQTLTRRWETVNTTWGPVRIKIANMNGTISNYAPEFEDCRALAEAHRVPLKQVMQEAARVYASHKN
jgi:pyridinium-3,5-bisthiocarboxylic acid mononucleotide nickel chelatase